MSAKNTWGTLTDSTTNEPIRPATRSEWDESHMTSEGHIEVDGALCYVADGPTVDLDALLREASSVGDTAMIAIVERALDGDRDALSDCLDVIADAHIDSID